MCAYLDLTKGAEEMSARLGESLEYYLAASIAQKSFPGVHKCWAIEANKISLEASKRVIRVNGSSVVDPWVWGRVEEEGEGAQAFGRHLRAPLSISAWCCTGGCGGCTSALPQGLCLGWEGYLSWLALNCVYTAWLWCSGWKAASAEPNGAGPEISLSG